MEKQHLTEAQMQYLMFLGINTRDASMSKEEAEALDSKLLSILNRYVEINIVNNDDAVDMICKLILEKL